MNDPTLLAMPPLHGWVATELKDRAEPVLKLKQEPLLATWNYGLGKSVAFTSDVQPRWASDWTRWGGFSLFWDRVFRWNLRGVGSAELYPRVAFDGGKGRLSVEAASSSGERLNFLNLKARIIRPDLEVEEVPLRQTAIGTYEVEFDADAPGAYLAGIVDDQGRQSTTGGMVSYSPEFKDFDSNDYLLHELAAGTGGKVNPTLDEIFRREGRAVPAAKDISASLLLLVLCLLVIEVGVRRLHFDEEQMAKFWNTVGRVVPMRRLATAGGPESGLPEGLKTRWQTTRTKLNRGGSRPRPVAPEAMRGAVPTEPDVKAAAKASAKISPETPRPREVEIQSADVMDRLKKRRGESTKTLHREPTGPAAAPKSSPTPKPKEAPKVEIAPRPAPPSAKPEAAELKEVKPAATEKPSARTEETKSPFERGEMTSRLLAARKKKKPDEDS